MEMTQNSPAFLGSATQFVCFGPELALPRCEAATRLSFTVSLSEGSRH